MYARLWSGAQTGIVIMVVGVASHYAPRVSVSRFIPASVRAAHVPCSLIMGRMSHSLLPNYEIHDEDNIFLRNVSEYLNK
jgi:hypothetical protein